MFYHIRRAAAALPGGPQIIFVGSRAARDLETGPDWPFSLGVKFPLWQARFWFTLRRYPFNANSKE